MIKFLLFSYLMLIGIIILFGFFIGLANRLFYKLLGKQARGVCIATGLIGTPIHEAGHALFCLIFGHKINEVKFYEPKGDTLGYVTHSYNKKNIYHVIGNFFIAIGPIILGTAVEMLLMYLLCKDSFKEFYNTYIASTSQNIGFGSFVDMTIGFLRIFFSLENIKNIKWWIFLIVSLLICLHINLSQEDIKGGIFGFVVTTVFCLIINLVIFLVFNNQIDLFYNTYSKFGYVAYSILILSAILSICLVIIALIYWSIKKIFGK